MARIPFVTPDDVPESERAAYDAFVQKRGSRPNAGPYALLLHMPELAQRLESLRLYIREEMSLPQRLQEIVMLTVAREMDCAYIWHAHAGRTQCVLESLNARIAFETRDLERKLPQGQAAAGPRLGRQAPAGRAVPAGNEGREREISRRRDPRRGL